MSVLVKGMKMPKGCWWRENGFYMECPLFDADHYCSQLRRWIKSDDGDRPHDCPLIEVPTPHGRLIDADALEQEMINGIKAGNYEDGYDDYPNINNMDDCVECVRYADTIIEAEEGAEE